MDRLFIEGVNQVGQKEIEGPEDNHVMVNYTEESHFGWVDEDEIHWCNIFLFKVRNMVDKSQSEEKSTKNIIEKKGSWKGTACYEVYLKAA